MFVLMGSFQSFSCNAATTDYAAVKANFTALAQLISDFARIAVRMTPGIPCTVQSPSADLLSRQRSPEVAMMLYKLGGIAAHRAQEAPIAHEGLWV